MNYPPPPAGMVGQAVGGMHAPKEARNACGQKNAQANAGPPQPRLERAVANLTETTQELEMLLAMGHQRLDQLAGPAPSEATEPSPMDKIAGTEMPQVVRLEIQLQRLHALVVQGQRSLVNRLHQL